MTFYTDRSRIQTYQRCNHRRLLEYHVFGTGIQPAQTAVPLSTGGSIHLGLQRLLEGASPDEAVQDALRYYRDSVATEGFQDTRSADQQYLISEQLALTEVMIRAWALKRLPLYLEQYEVLEIEKESPPAELAPGIVLLRRPDGILRNRFTDFIETLSFKTAKQYGFKNDKMNENDMQGISETWAVAQKYGEAAVGPVIMEFLVTGPRKLADANAITEGEDYDALSDNESEFIQPVGAPLKWQWNPFIRAWRDNYGNVSWRFKMPSAEGDGMPTMAKFFNPHFGKKPSKATPIIPKYEAKPFAVWEEMPVKDWFERMSAGQVFPQWCDPFEGMFVSRKYSRMPYELEEWRSQTARQEQRVQRGLVALACSETPESRQEVIDEFFPKSRHSCFYPSNCPMANLCWKGVTDPFTVGFKPRIPNHPQELEKEVA